MKSLLTGISALLLIALLSASCENDIKVVNNLNSPDTLPVETAKNIELIYSDSGEMQVWLKSPLYNTYEGKNPYTEFPKGVEVIFYNPGKKVKSTMKANYAIIYQKTKIMEARYNVVVVGVEKNESLNTEHLVWDERSRKIYSDDFVKVTTHDKVLFGQGFESDQSFDNWFIRKPTGFISVKPDE